MNKQIINLCFAMCVTLSKPLWGSDSEDPFAGLDPHFLDNFCPSPLTFEENEEDSAPPFESFEAAPAPEEETPGPAVGSKRGLAEDHIDIPSWIEFSKLSPKRKNLLKTGLKKFTTQNLTIKAKN